MPERGLVFWQMDYYPWNPKGGDKPRPQATEIVRSGDWKLLAFHGTPAALYDLSADPGERTNLLSTQPERASEMTEALGRWLAETRPGSL